MKTYFFPLLFTLQTVSLLSQEHSITEVNSLNNDVEIQLNIIDFDFFSKKTIINIPSIDLFNVEFKHVFTDKHKINNIVWVGESRSQFGATVHLIKNNKQVSAILKTSNNQTYHTNYNAKSNAYSLSLVNPNGKKLCSNIEVNEVERPKSKLSSISNAINCNTCASCHQVSIDVMVLYTTEAKTSIGTTSAIETSIVSSITEANQANIRSNISHRFNLVHYEEFSHDVPMSSNFQDDLLLRFNLASGESPFNNVSVLRNQYKADIVVLVTKDNTLSSGGGLTFAPRPSLPFGADIGFIIVEITPMRNTYALIHELGHTLGLVHDKFTHESEHSGNPNADPYCENLHGYVDLENRFFTVMSYPDECVSNGIDCIPIPYWATPNTTYQGNPVSSNEANVLEGLKQSFCIVSQYRGDTPVTYKEVEIETSNPVSYDWNAQNQCLFHVQSCNNNLLRNTAIARNANNQIDIDLYINGIFKSKVVSNYPFTEGENHVPITIPSDPSYLTNSATLKVYITNDPSTSDETAEFPIVCPVTIDNQQPVLSSTYPTLCLSNGTSSGALLSVDGITLIPDYYLQWQKDGVNITTTNSENINLIAEDYGAGLYTVFMTDGTGCAGNISNTIQVSVDNCAIAPSGTCPTPTNIQAFSVTTTSAVLDWSQMGNAYKYDIRYRQTGSSTWQTLSVIDGGGNCGNLTCSVNIRGLTKCKTYEFQVRNNCGNNEISEWSAIETFTTLCSSATCGNPITYYKNTNTFDDGSGEFTPYSAGPFTCYYAIDPRDCLNGGNDAVSSISIKFTKFDLISYHNFPSNPQGAMVVVRGGNNLNILAKFTKHTNTDEGSTPPIIGYNYTFPYKFIRLEFVNIDPNIGLDGFTVEYETNCICSDPETPTISSNDNLILCDEASPTVELVSALNGGINNYQYQWQKNEIDIAGERESTYTVSEAGDYRLYLTDGLSCSTTYSNTLTVTSPFSVNTAYVTPTCYADNGVASIQPNTGGNIGFVQWDANAGNQIGLSAYGLAGGTYAATVTDEYGCSLISSVTIPIQDIVLGETKLLAFDGAAGDRFGNDVSTYGNKTAIACYFDDDNGGSSGSVYVYEHTGILEQKLIPDDGAGQDQFGNSISMYENVIVVGAIGDDDNGSGSGSVYVFRYNGTEWVQEQKLLSPDGAAFDRFGNDVYVDNNIIVVSSEYDDDNGTSSGSVYVFRYNGTEWILDQKLIASDAAAGDQFGHSVALEDSLIVIGSRNDDDNGGNSGSAYVFKYNGTSWEEKQKLIASDGTGSDIFGKSVSISDKVIVVGCSFEDAGMIGNSGASYVFRHNGSSWVEEQKLSPHDPVNSGYFGNSVSVSGNFIAIGTYLDNDKGLYSGSVYSYVYRNGLWNFEEKLTASDGSTNDQYGFSVSASSNALAVGVHLNDEIDSDVGSAYIYLLSEGSGDSDMDGICDDFDNCTTNFNPSQSDADANGIGDLCDCEISKYITITYNGSITKTESVTSTITSTSTIESGANIEYIAGQSITLNTGFYAKSGSEFLARIDACSPPNTSNLVEETTPQAVSHNAPSVIEQTINNRKLTDLHIYPNPTNQSINIEYILYTPQQTSIYLMDFSGRVVQTRNKGVLAKGAYTDVLDFGDRLSSGFYFVVLKTEGGSVSKKVVYQK